MNGCRSRLLPQLGGRTYMPTDIVMPQMGESIFEGTITKWLKKPGDKVQRDEPLFEISTDKVDAEIPAPASGVLQEIKVAEGNTVQVNTVVGVIGDGNGAAASAPAKAAAASAPSAPAPPKKEPQAAAPSPVAPATDHTEDESDVRSSPLVRKLAREQVCEPGVRSGHRIHLLCGLWPVRRVTGRQLVVLFSGERAR